jgi:hypothetical protein
MANEWTGWGRDISPERKKYLQGVEGSRYYIPPTAESAAATPAPAASTGARPESIGTGGGFNTTISPAYNKPLGSMGLLDTLNMRPQQPFSPGGGISVPTYVPANPQGAGWSLTPDQMLTSQIRMKEIESAFQQALMRYGIDVQGLSLQEMVQKMNAAQQSEQMKQNRAIAQRNLQTQAAQIPAQAGLGYMSNVVSPYYLQAMRMPTAANKAAATSYF